jgi:general secretion pathway protein N
VIRTRWLVALGLLAFLATLLLHAPASLVYAWSRGAKPATGGAVLHGVHGTLVAGGFTGLTVNNRPLLGEGRWALHPWWLPLLRLSADFEVGGDTVIRVGVSRAVFGKLRLSGLNAAGNVKALLGSLGQPALPVDGQARLELPVIRLDDGRPVEARGTAEIQNLAWTLAREPLPLGSFTADLSTDDKGIRVDMTSGPGALELSGAATLAPDQAYDLHLQLRPRPQAPEQLLTLVRSLGQPDAQGWYHVRRNGSLAPPPKPQ